ncbi:MAG: PorP/SprF family type IX secretion system membrane protein [Chitinophagales bacterium]
MMKIYKITCVAAFFAMGVLQAQDIHFSQYNQAPLALNPGLTGVNACDWRAGITYRNQWASVTTPYVTYEAFADMPIIKSIGRGGSRLAGGLLLYNDVSGDGNLTNLSALGNVSYVLGLGRADHSISLGLQAGLMQKSLDFNALKWPNQWNGSDFDQNQMSYEPVTGDNISKFNMGFGLAYNNVVSPSFNITGGFAMFNLVSPSESFLDDPDNKLGARMVGHVKAGFTFNKQIIVAPTVLYQTQSKAQEILVGADFGYILNNANFPATFYLGAHDRLDDAIIAVVGMDYKNFRFGASYDINNSSLKDASSGKGGFEISLVYTGCILPVIPSNYDMPCPRY